MWRVSWSDFIIGQERKDPPLRSSLARSSNMTVYHLLYWRLEVQTGRRWKPPLDLKKILQGLQRGWGTLHQCFRVAATEFLWKFHHRLRIGKCSLPCHHWRLVRDFVFENQHHVHLYSLTLLHSNWCWPAADNYSEIFRLRSPNQSLFLDPY